MANISWRLVGLALAAGALVACGGGGSSIGDSTVTLNGFAQKGILKQADVKAYAIQSDGTPAATAAASGTTTDTGTFTLSPAVSTTQRYLIVVKPTAATKHVDEVQGEQALGSDFVLKAVAAQGASTAAVTPLSYQEVKAAESAGGLSADNVVKAKAVVTELYGFDPVAVKQDDKALKVVLQAVSQMTKDGSLGCSTSTDPTCVVNALASATTTASLKLEKTASATTAAVDVSSALKAAIETAVTNLSKDDSSINAGTVITVTTKLACTSSCTPAAPVEGGTASSISSVKTVLAEILTDLRTMFSNEGSLSASAKGAFNQQAFTFKQTVQDVKFNLDQPVSDMKALLLGVRYWQDVKNGASFSTSGKGQNTGNLPWLYGYYGGVNAQGCTLYQDATLNRPASSQDNANFIGCVSRYGHQAVVSFGSNEPTSSTTYTEWLHGFTLTPDAADSNKFAYVARAQKHVWSCTGYPWSASNNYGKGSACGNKTKTSLLTDANGAALNFAGSVLARKDSSGRYNGGSLSGDLPPAFVLANKNSQGYYGVDAVGMASDQTRYGWALDVSATGVDSTGETSSWTFGGQVSKYNGASKLVDVVLKDGSTVDRVKQTAQLDLTASVYGSSNTASLSGALTLDKPATDKSGNSTQPTHLKFVGTLSNTPVATGSSKTEALQGTLDLIVSGYDKYDSTQPQSATNAMGLTGSLSLSVTAPNQPRLEVVLATSGKSWQFQDSVTNINVSYNRYNGTTKTRAVNLAVTRDAPSTANTSPLKTLTLSEASTGLSISATEGGSNKMVDVKAGGIKIGVLDTDKSLFTFSDGSITSMVLWP